MTQKQKEATENPGPLRPKEMGFHVDQIRVQRGRQKRLLMLVKGPSIFEKEIWEGSGL